MPVKLNKAFWKWFGDSVVRNEDGSPKVVYHGSIAGDGEINEFDSDRLAFFSPSRRIATEYAHGDSRSVGAYYLRLVNPLVADGPQDVLCKLPPILKKSHAGAERSWEVLRDVHLPELYQDDDVVAALISRGYDGLIVRDDLADDIGAHMSFAVFQPEQIKSINNDGTWDADDPDIGSNPPRVTVDTVNTAISRTGYHLERVPFHQTVKSLGPVQVWDLIPNDPDSELPMLSITGCLSDIRIEDWPDKIEKTLKKHYAINPLKESALPEGFEGFDVTPEIPSGPLSDLEMKRRGLFHVAKVGQLITLGGRDFRIVSIFSPHEAMVSRIGDKRKTHRYNIWQQDDVMLRNQHGTFESTMATPVLARDTFESALGSIRDDYESENPPVHAIRSIERRHAVTDPDHVFALAKSIRAHGWQGPPLVIWGPINWGNSVMLTGVHRMAALDLLLKQDREFAEGLDIPVLVVDQQGLSEEVIDDTGIHWDGDIVSLYDSDEIATLLDAMGEREAASLVRDEGGDVLGADDPRVGSNPRKASAPKEIYTLRHVVDHLKKTDGTGDPEWMRRLIKEVSPYPVWELHGLDPSEVENHCSDKETADEYAKVIDELPPAVAIPSSGAGRLKLVDGGHRFYAASLVGTAFPCYIPAGMRGLK